jgi:hypothetical protein
MPVVAMHCGPRHEEPLSGRQPDQIRQGEAASLTPGEQRRSSFLFLTISCMRSVKRPLKPSFTPQTERGAKK